MACRPSRSPRSPMWPGTDLSGSISASLSLPKTKSVPSCEASETKKQLAASTLSGASACVCNSQPERRDQGRYSRGRRRPLLRLAAMYLAVFDDNPYATNCWLLGMEGRDDALVVDPGFFAERV